MGTIGRDEEESELDGEVDREVENPDAEAEVEAEEADGEVGEAVDEEDGALDREAVYSDDRATGADRPKGDPARDEALVPERWHGVPNVCGSCIAWRPDALREGDAVATGLCRLRPELGRVPATLKKCDLYKGRGQFVYQPPASPSARKKRSSGPTVLRRTEAGTIERLRPAASSSRASRMTSKAAASFGLLPTESSATESSAPRSGQGEGRGLLPGAGPVAVQREVPRRARPDAPREIDLGGEESVPVIRRALEELIRQELGRSRREMTPKYRGGLVRLVGEGGSPVDVDPARVFSMIDRLRSAIDALEGAIRRKFGPEDQVELLEIVRRMHGSFTTLNVMIAHREDHFSGKE